MKDDFQLDKNNSGDYLLSISNSDLKFKQGDKIQIKITLKNKTKEEIYFFVICNTNFIRICYLFNHLVNRLGKIL